MSKYRRSSRKWQGHFMGTVAIIRDGKATDVPVFIKDLDLPLDKIRGLARVSLLSDQVDWSHVHISEVSRGRWKVLNSLDGRTVAFGPYKSCLYFIGLSRYNLVQQDVELLKYKTLLILQDAKISAHDPLKKAEAELALKRARQIASWVKGDFHSLVYNRAKRIEAKIWSVESEAEKAADKKSAVV